MANPYSYAQGLSQGVQTGLAILEGYDQHRKQVQDREYREQAQEWGAQYRDKFKQLQEQRASAIEAVGLDTIEARMASPGANVTPQDKQALQEKRNKIIATNRLFDRKMQGILNDMAMTMGDNPYKQKSFKGAFDVLSNQLEQDHDERQEQSRFKNNLAVEEQKDIMARSRAKELFGYDKELLEMRLAGEKEIAGIQAGAKDKLPAGVRDDIRVEVQEEFNTAREDYAVTDKMSEEDKGDKRRKEGQFLLSELEKRGILTSDEVVSITKSPMSSAQETKFRDWAYKTLETDEYNKRVQAVGGAGELQLPERPTFKTPKKGPETTETKSAERERLEGVMEEVRQLEEAYREISSQLSVWERGKSAVFGGGITQETREELEGARQQILARLEALGVPEQEAHRAEGFMRTMGATGRELEQLVRRERREARAKETLERFRGR